MTRRTYNGTIGIAYEDLGGSGGEPLLLSMGLGTTRFWWPAGLVAALISAGFHVVAYDQRDSGESDRLPEQGGGNPIAGLFRKQSGYGSVDLVGDAAAVLDAVGWDSAHLFGHSMGGAVVQAFALHLPHRVRSVTSSASPSVAVGALRRFSYIRLGTLARFTRMRFPDTPEGDIEFGLAVSRALASPDNPPDEQWVRDMMERDRAIGVRSFRDEQAQSRQTAARWHGAPLSQLTAPTLVLHGADDPLIRPKAGRDVAAAVPDARLVLLPGVGHDLPAAAWPAVVDEVRALADRASTPSPPRRRG
jgi:pimeloyl-ACP methyl ester carboxylesterase